SKRFATAQEMRSALEAYLRSSGEDVGRDELASTMQRAFAEEQATMRRRIQAQIHESPTTRRERMSEAHTITSRFTSTRGGRDRRRTGEDPGPPSGLRRALDDSWRANFTAFPAPRQHVLMMPQRLPPALQATRPAVQTSKWPRTMILGLIVAALAL